MTVDLTQITHAGIPTEFVPFSCAPYSLYIDDLKKCPCLSYGVVGVNHAGEYVTFVNNVEYTVAMFCLHALATATDTEKYTSYDGSLTLSKINEHNTNR